MNATVQRWGNSLALRIPSSLAKDVRLHQGTVVEVAVVEGKIVVRPRGKRRYSLSRMLRGVSRQNRHEERNWGGRTGREIW